MNLFKTGVKKTLLKLSMDWYCFVFVFICLWFFVPLENFSRIWRRHQILTYAWYLWPLSSEGYLSCHTSCDTGHPFIMVISEDPWHSHLMPIVWHWSCHYLFLRLSYVAGIRTPSACGANTLTNCATTAAIGIVVLLYCYVNK